MLLGSLIERTIAISPVGPIGRRSDARYRGVAAWPDEMAIDAIRPEFAMVDPIVEAIAAQHHPLGFPGMSA